MRAVNETVLEAQLEIVNKKMKKYEEELYLKIDNRVKMLNFEFENHRRETSVGLRGNEGVFRAMSAVCIMTLRLRLPKDASFWRRSLWALRSSIRMWIRQVRI